MALEALTREGLLMMNNDIYKSILKIKEHCDKHTCAGCDLGVESVHNEGLVTCILDCCPAEWDRNMLDARFNK